MPGMVVGWDAGDGVPVMKGDSGDGGIIPRHLLIGRIERPSFSTGAADNYRDSAMEGG